MTELIVKSTCQSLDRSREARSNREKRVRSLQPTDLYKVGWKFVKFSTIVISNLTTFTKPKRFFQFTKDQISGPLSAIFQSSSPLTQQHHQHSRTSRISRSLSLRSSTKIDLISDVISSLVKVWITNFSFSPYQFLIITFTALHNHHQWKHTWLTLIHH